MKKILAALLVLALVAPAMADVAVTAADLTGGHLKITITPTGGAVVRGVALLLTRTAGDAVIDATGDVVATQFNTFIDYAFDNAGYVIGTGHAIADPAAAGVATLPASVFSLSAGYLDQAGAQAGITTPSTFDITYTQTASSTIGIALDTLRGGIVGDTLGAITVQASQVLAADAECVKSTAAFYAAWVSFGKPDCWCFPRNCRGDVNKLKTGLSNFIWVNSVDLAVFSAAYNKTESVLKTVVVGGVPGACADNNRLKSGLSNYIWVNSVDLGIFSSYYNKTETNTPVCDLAPNYNFWK